MARIAVGGFQHETNTFAPQQATWEEFVRADAWPPLLRGPEMIAGVEGFNIPISGAVKRLAELGHGEVAEAKEYDRADVPPADARGPPLGRKASSRRCRSKLRVAHGRDPPVDTNVSNSSPERNVHPRRKAARRIGRYADGGTTQVARSSEYGVRYVFSAGPSPA